MVFGILALIFISLRPLVEFGVNQYFGTEFTSIQTNVSNVQEGLFRLIWVMIAGIPEPLFPYLGTTFIGCIVGILLSQDKPIRNFIRLGYASGIIIIFVGSILFIFGEDSFSFVFGIMPLYYYLFHLGMQIITLFFALRVVEFNPKYPKKFEKYGLFIRRWGVLSLTVYFLQGADIISREILYRITGIPFNVSNQVNSGLGLLMVAIVMIFWEIFIRLWEKFKFKYSLDWFLLKLNSFFGKEFNKDDPLSVKGILYEDMEPIRYVE
jgi:hypothetical protein